MAAELIAGPMSQIRIETPTLQDWAALCELEDHCFSGDRLSPRQMRHWIEADQRLFLVARQNAQLLAYGLVFLRRDSPAARLYSLAVDPKARGQGLARQLLRALESAAVDQHRREMRLEVAAGNLAATRLYESLGYQPFGRQEAYYADGQAALRLRKALRPASDGLNQDAGLSHRGKQTESK